MILLGVGREEARGGPGTVWTSTQSARKFHAPQRDKKRNNGEGNGLFGEGERFQQNIARLLRRS